MGCKFGNKNVGILNLSSSCFRLFTILQYRHFHSEGNGFFMLDKQTTDNEVKRECPNSME